MKIHSIRIDGFGRFAGAEFGPLTQSVILFHGPNEAGKSTLLEFIRRMLFGFPRKNRNINAYPAMAGGNYGGIVTVEGADGRLYDVCRTTGKRYGGEVAVTSESGDVFPEAELSRLLGHHSRDVFEQVFAFTLDELHSDKLLNDENVNSQIYSAGMGVKSLSSAMESIESRREALFRKGGSTQKIYKVSREIEEIDGKLKEVANTASQYAQLNDRLSQIAKDLDRLKDRQRTLQSQHEHQRRLSNAWNEWNDLVSAERRLAQLPVVDDFPPEGVTRLKALEERVEDAREELDAAERHVENAQAKVELPIEHEAISNQSAAVRDLERRRSAFDQSVKDIPEREAELEARRNDLSNTLADLGPDWDVERLTEFDLSIVVREEISDYERRLTEARDDVGRRESVLEGNETALEEASQGVDRARQEFDAVPRPRLDRDEIRETRSRMRTARSTLNELDRNEDRAGDLREQLDDGADVGHPAPKRDVGKVVAGSILGIAAITSVVFVILALGTNWASELSIGMILVSTISVSSLAAVGVYFIMRGGSSAQPGDSPVAVRIRRQIEEADERSAELRTRLSENASTLGVDAVNANSLDAAEESLVDEEARLNESNRLGAALREAKNRVKQRRARRDSSGQAVEGARGALASIEDEWRQWLADRGLLETFSPANIQVLRELVDNGRTRHTRVTEMEKRIAAIHTDIEEFIEAAQPLALAHGFELDRSDHARVAVIADELIDLHKGVVERLSERANAKDELASAEEELCRREQRLTKANDEIAALLRDAGAESSDAFIQRGGIYTARQELKRKVDTALDRLQRLSGPGEPLESLKTDLGSTDHKTIALEIDRLNEELKKVGSQRDELSDKRAAAESKLPGLIGEKESSRLRMDRNVLLEQVRECAREWTKLTLAKNLLGEARGKFELERQPGVVRHAEEFFTRITEGRYGKVFAPLGQQTITVTDASDSSNKQPSELSRGTREQLFLSLRFGLIRELGKRTEPLPVVVDEVLVNFDPERAFGAAQAFVELSRTNQVLVFTCHPTVVDLFRRAAAEKGTEAPRVIPIA